MASKELELLDLRLLQAAANGYSPEEMSRKYPSVTPAEAAVRVKEMLASRDIWDEVEKQQLLLHSAYAVKEKMEALLDDLDLLDDVPKHIDVYVKLLKTMDGILEKRTKLTEAEMEQITRAHARAMMGMIEAGYQRARDLLAQEYPMVDLLEIDAAFNQGMKQASYAQEEDD